MKDISIVKESVVLKAGNPIVLDPSAPITEAAVANMKIGDVQAVYPLIRALNADKLTKNATFYPEKTIIGKQNKLSPTGYASFVSPHPKPVIREHKLQSSWFDEAESPIGRLLWAAYEKHADPKSIVVAPKGLPGFTEGCGALKFVACISDQEAVPKVLGGAYHTVSVGSRCGKIIESISGSDLVALSQQGKELPPFSKGQYYEVNKEEKLSYWTMQDMSGLEMSYVNVPSDVHAFNEEADLGIDAIRVLLGEKKVGQKEYSFYDALTTEKVMDMAAEEFSMFSPAFEFIDSAKIPQYFIIDKPEFSAESEESEVEATETETSDEKQEADEKEIKVGSLVSFEDSIGKLLSINGQEAVVRELKNNRFSAFPQKIALSQLSLSENQGDFSISESIKDNKPKIKDYFLKNFKPDSKFQTESPLSLPLLALTTKTEWTESDYVLAWTFEQISTNNDKENKKIWGFGTNEKVDLIAEKINKALWKN